MAPEALPDGSLLVTRADERRNWQLFRFRRSTNQLDALPAWLPSGILASAVRVFPDGREAVFVGRTTEEQQPARLHVMDLESHTVRRIGPRVELPASFWYPLAVSQDGAAALINLPLGKLHRIVSVPRDGS
jgi:hypothetical protein